MKYLLIIITLFLSVTSNCQNIENTENYSYKITKSEQGYGYKIYKNNKLFINQSFIPSLKSKKTFSTSDDAAKIARLVIIKLNNGVFPPSIEYKDLKENNIQL